MKPVTVKELKQELYNRSPVELLELCLRLSKFKKENKELLTYLLFESADEASFVESLKMEIDQQFELINRKTYYYIKKSVRKILSGIKKHSRYSLKKETEIDLLIHFCAKLRSFNPPVKRNPALQNIYNRQMETIRKKICYLHEDLQYDYGAEISRLNL